MHSYGIKRPLLAAMCVAVLLTTAALTPGCATIKRAFEDPNKALAAQIAVQYGTGKFIEAGKTPMAQATRAAEVRKVAESIKAATNDESATLATLRALALQKVAGAHLAPADQLLANTLVDVTLQELANAVRRQVAGDAGGVITVGVLDPEAKLAVHKLLDWVIAAASIYG